jgi:carboxyl-terminal processing protease
VSHRHTLLVLLLLGAFTSPVLGEPLPPSNVPPNAFDRALAAEVLGSGLAFLAPRTLDPVSIPQLTIWGLRGLTAIDPMLAPSLAGPDLRLAAGDRMLITRTAPPDDNPEAWGAAAAELADAAWSSSALLRRAGTQGFITSFFDELFNHLDPYSRYVPPRDAQADRDRRTGEAGAGIRLAGRRGAVTVAEITAESPADAAGVRLGDTILEVDDQKVGSADPATVAGWIAGPEDTPLSLVVRGRDGRIRTLEMQRALVPPETVFTERRGPLLIIHITSFNSTTGQRLAHVLADALKEDPVPGRKPPPKIEGIVIDLRGNRGGLLRQAVTAADTLLPAGVIARTAGRNPDSTRQWASSGANLAGDLPVVVIVDGRSASAAEVMAAALADRGRAVVVGSATLGKGLVQTITPLPDGGELFVTWSRVLAPRGWPLQGLGVLPQVCTSLGAEALKAQLAALAEGQQPMEAAIERQRSERAPISPNQIIDIRNACPAAEGRDGDMDAAKFLIANPAAYATALLPPM